MAPRRPHYPRQREHMNNSCLDKNDVGKDVDADLLASWCCGRAGRCLRFLLIWPMVILKFIPISQKSYVSDRNRPPRIFVSLVSLVWAIHWHRYCHRPSRHRPCHPAGNCKLTSFEKTVSYLAFHKQNIGLTDAYQCSQLKSIDINIPCRLKPWLWQSGTSICVDEHHLDKSIWERANRWVWQI